jgi:dCMP deaminase
MDTFLILYSLRFKKKGILMKKKNTTSASAHKRDDWHTYFMNIARQVGTRSTCDRKHVGAVIVRDKTILSTGYNGSIRGSDHCDEVGHMMENGHCIATIHAEANAILQAAKNGVAINEADIYISASPCWNCFKLIANAGIRRIFYGEFYRDERSLAMAKKLKIEIKLIQ